MPRDCETSRAVTAFAIEIYVGFTRIDSEMPKYHRHAILSFERSVCLFHAVFISPTAWRLAYARRQLKAACFSCVTEYQRAGRLRTPAPIRSPRPANIATPRLIKLGTNSRSGPIRQPRRHLRLVHFERDGRCLAPPRRFQCDCRCIP